MAVVKITRLMLHEIIIAHSQDSENMKKNRVIDFLKETFCTNERATKILITFIKLNFFLPYFRFWKCCHRKNETFLTKHNEWLNKNIEFPNDVIQCLPGLSSASSIESERNRGRTRKNFDESSNITKRRKIKEFRESKSSSELVYATTIKLREEGDIASAELLKESTSTTPTRSKKF